MTTKTKRNWKEYNDKLVARGNITFWFDRDVVNNWTPKSNTVKRERPILYSDVAIEAILTLCEVLHLTYRSAEGYGWSLLVLSVIDNITAADYTSLCKRAKTLDVGVKVQIYSTKPKITGKVKSEEYNKRRFAPAPIRGG